MSRYFERELGKLKKEFLILSGKVEENYNQAVRALTEFDVELAKQVVVGDDEIDQMEVDLEETCLQILALYQPFATDLRYIVAVLKINNDLERIGDLSAGMARRTKGFKKHEFTLPPEITKMTSIVSKMLTDALNAFTREDIELARQVMRDDDEVDELNVKIYEITKGMIKEGEERASDMIHLLTVSRNLERAADHVTNIAEDIIYFLEGAIVRHAAIPEEPEGS